MRKSTIDKLCDTFNQRLRLEYPMRGHIRFSDIRGDGSNRRKVYMNTNDGGGVTAMYNGATYRQTAANLRDVIAALDVY